MRGFTLDGFLSDYEEPGAISPWVVGNDGWISSKQKPPLPAPPTEGSRPDPGPTSGATGGQKPQPWQKLFKVYNQYELRSGGVTVDLDRDCTVEQKAYVLR